MVFSGLKIRVWSVRFRLSPPLFPSMAYFCYVLKSSKIARLNKGHTEDLHRRLKQHNAGKTRSTRQGIPWTIIYSESFSSLENALLREKYFKTLAGGKYLPRSSASAAGNVIQRIFRKGLDLISRTIVVSGP